MYHDRRGGVLTYKPPEHDCLDHFDDGRNDPATPEHIVHYECQICGEFWEFDTETGEHTVDR